MRHLGGIAALIALVMGAYWGIGDYAFVDFDDDVYLLDNPHVRDGLSWDSAAWAFTTGHHSNWHPLTWLSYLAEIEFFGLDPGPMHVTNVLLHIAVCVLLYALLFRTTGAYGLSLFAAAVFAVHPLHVEAVAWISERKEVLSAVFALLALHAYASNARRASAPMYGFALIACAASLMAKPMWVTFPILLIPLDRWPLQRVQSLRASLIEKAPFFAVACAAGLATLLAQGGGESVQSLETIPIGLRFGNAVLAYGVYLIKTVWPADLAIFYPHPRESLSWPLAGLSLIALLLITAAVYRLRRSHPSLAMGWAWFVVTLLPVIGMLQVGGQAYADRYTYVPHIGLFAGIVFALPWPAGVAWRRGLAAAAGGLVAACAVVTFAHVRHWKDTETLFTHAIAATENNVLAHSVLSRHFAERGAPVLAEHHARAAVRINPDFADGWLDLGSALFAQDRHLEAEAALDRFLVLRPKSATGWYYRARALDAQHDSAATVSFERALDIDPDNPVIRTAYGNLLAREAVDRGGEGMDAAARQFALALEADPNYRLAHLNLGRSLALMGRTGESEYHLKIAEYLATAPENTP